MSTCITRIVVKGGESLLTSYLVYNHSLQLHTPQSVYIVPRATNTVSLDLERRQQRRGREKEWSMREEKSETETERTVRESGKSVGGRNQYTDV